MTPIKQALMVCCLHAGPVTILNWSFPRKDITRKAQSYQLALALRKEVAALEEAGCKVIQVLLLLLSCHLLPLWEEVPCVPTYQTCNLQQMY